MFVIRWILRLGGDNLLEGRRRLFQIAALKHRHPEGEVVPLERVLVEHPAQGKRPPDLIGLRTGYGPQIFDQPFGMHQPLVNLNNHGVLIEKERSRNGQIPATVEQVTINDVVDVGHILGGEKVGEGEPFSGGE